MTRPQPNPRRVDRHVGRGSAARIAHHVRRSVAFGGGLLDEVIVNVAPVLVGDGVQLFERPGGEPVKLTPISSGDEGAMTVLRYSVGHGGAAA
jgi:hypothetical protein